MFKDSDGYIYRRTTINHKDVYLKCQREHCYVSVCYNMDKNMAYFMGKHTNHSVNENDIRLIELSFTMRSRALDPKFNHLKCVELYKQCVDEFNGILLPDGHKMQSFDAIRYLRKRKEKMHRQNPNQNSNTIIKLNTTIPKRRKMKMVWTLE